MGAGAGTNLESYPPFLKHDPVSTYRSGAGSGNEFVLSFSFSAHQPNEMVLTIPVIVLG